MRNYKANTVDEYIHDAPEDSRAHLSELRKVVRAILPDAEEKIAWGIPFYKNQGGYLAGFSAFKAHVSFGFAFRFSDAEQAKLKAAGYKVNAKTFQIRFDQSIPTEQIKEILKAR